EIADRCTHGQVLKLTRRYSAMKLVGFRAGAREIAGIQLPHCVEYKRAEIACKQELRPRLLRHCPKGNLSRDPARAGTDGRRGALNHKGKTLRRPACLGSRAPRC